MKIQANGGLLTASAEVDRVRKGVFLVFLLFALFCFVCCFLFSRALSTSPKKKKKKKRGRGQANKKAFRPVAGLV